MRESTKSLCEEIKHSAISMDTDLVLNKWLSLFLLNALLYFKWLWGSLTEDLGSECSDRIELMRPLYPPPVHSDLSVIYMMEGILWRARIPTVTFYPHQMFPLKTL